MMPMLRLKDSSRVRRERNRGGIFTTGERRRSDGLACPRHDPVPTRFHDLPQLGIRNLEFDDGSPQVLDLVQQFESLVVIV
jgi:hypothetical protein